MKPKASIIICTFNRATLLDDCLSALEKQSVDRSTFEVIIIDNNSDDATQDLCNGYVRRNVNFSLFREDRQGLSFARNRGLQESAADWIAYVDDDARVFPDYVEKLLSFCTDHPEAGCFGGPCVPLYHHSKPKWYLDEYQTARPTDARIALLDDHSFVSGFNIVFNKSKLQALNGFNPLIGMTGKKIAYGEETQVQIRMRKNGGSTYYYSDLLVYHYIDSYKLRFLWFFKSSFANGRDSWETFEQTPSLRERLKTLGSAARLPFRKFPTAWQRYRQGQYQLQNLLIDCFSSAFWNVGRAVSMVHEGRGNVSSTERI